jgi:recombination protein RecA
VLSTRAAHPDGQKAAPRFCLSELAGRMVEITARGAAAPLTQAMALVREAQAAGEPAAWISPLAHCFYPPDAAAVGVDLAALPVLRVSDAATAGRAADKLLRSGAFALVVLDLAGDAALPSPLLARLAGLARRHHSALLFLTEPGDGGSRLGSLISLRAESHRRREDGGFVCELRVVKDRRHGPGWSAQQRCLGVAGLR